MPSCYPNSAGWRSCVIAGLPRSLQRGDVARTARATILDRDRCVTRDAISIPDEVYNTFSVTGTSHILVVSGWNFTIVAAMLAGITGRLRLGRGFTLAASLAVLWVYALFVGATGTVSVLPLWPA